MIFLWISHHFTPDTSKAKGSNYQPSILDISRHPPLLGATCLDVSSAPERAAGPSCHAAWKKAWHLWHLGENRYLQEHPVWVTWGGCILNSPPNMAWTMYNDHITITISKYDSDFGCYAPQLGTLPKMPLFACQVQKSKGKCKMSHHWVII